MALQKNCLGCETATLEEVQELLACSNRWLGSTCSLAVIVTAVDLSAFTGTSDTDWQTLIDDDQARIIKNVRIDRPTGTPIEINSKRVCNEVPVIIGSEHEWSALDANISSANNIMWSNLNGKQVYLAVYQDNYTGTLTPEIILISSCVNVTALPAMSPDNSREEQMYEIKFKFELPANWVDYYTTIDASAVTLFS